MSSSEQHLSQAALIWRQFRRRPLAVAAGSVIVALVTLSIWAPFLAHDRPLYYRGVNRTEYREVIRTLRELAGRLPVTATATTASGPAQSAANRQTWTLIELQCDLIRPSLPAGWQSWLDEWLRDLRSAQTSPDGATQLRELQRTLRQELGGNDVTLVPRRRWPVIASLSWADVFFMAWNVALLTAWAWWPAINRAFPPPRRRLRRFALFLCWIGIPAMCAAAWWWCVPARIDRTNYKAGVLAGDTAAATVLYETVTWPPIPYGIDENVLSNTSLKPAFWKEEPDRRPPQLGMWDKPHWLGTDELGRDVLCRMIWGGRVSLAVGIVAVSIYVTIGIVVGALAGYFRGVCDLIISRLIEVVICFPAFFLILTIVAFIGPGLFNIMVVIGLTGWTSIARLVRGEFLRLVDQEFVLAGRALGYTPLRLIFRHILPNAMAPVLVSATFGVAGAILTESSLSFLGLGIKPPMSSWGNMLHSGRDAIFRAPWMILFPGLAIFVTITCYNLVGEALRDAADPRLRGSR